MKELRRRCRWQPSSGLQPSEVGELFAGAVQAPMGATHAARPFQAGSKGLAGSVKPYGQVILRDVEILRDLGGGFTVQIDTTEQIRVTGPKCWQDVV